MTDRPLDAIEQAIAVALRDTLPAVVDQLATLAGPRAYSVAQVAERLELSEASVRRLINAGHLPTVPHLSPARVSVHALDEFLAGKR